MKKLFVIIASLLAAGASFAHEGKHTAHKKSAKEKTVKVTISEDGFKPAQIEGQKGEDLVLLVTRTTDKTCMTELKNVNGKGETKLPLNKEVRFQVGHLDKSGDIKLLCGMDMKAGIVKVL